MSGKWCLRRRRTTGTTCSTTGTACRTRAPLLLLLLPLLISNGRRHRWLASDYGTGTERRELATGGCFLFGCFEPARELRNVPAAHAETCHFTLWVMAPALTSKHVNVQTANAHNMGTRCAHDVTPMSKTCANKRQRAAYTIPPTPRHEYVTRCSLVWLRRFWLVRQAKQNTKRDQGENVFSPKMAPRNAQTVEKYLHFTLITTIRRRTNGNR